MVARMRRGAGSTGVSRSGAGRAGTGSPSCRWGSALRVVWAVVAVVLALAVPGCSGGGAGSGGPSTTGSTSRQLEWLSLDSAGWSHSSQLRGLYDGFPPGLAANDEAVVALVGDRPEAFRSTDGLAWQPTEGFPEMFLGCPFTVAGGPLGFVAAGFRDTGADGVPNTPVVAFSTDGARWEEIDPRALPTDEIAWFTDVFAGPDGFLALGAGATLMAGGPEGFAWFSPDGRTWTAAGLGLAFGGPSTAASTGDGWVVITEYSTRSSDRGVWTSEDGQTWSKVETVSTPPRGSVTAYCGTVPLAVLGDTWVLPETERSSGPGMVVWVSTDAGVTWNQHTVLDVPADPWHGVHDLAATPSGFVLTGWGYEEPEGEHALVSYSTDGTTWETTSSTDTEAITRIATMGDTLILVGEDLVTHVWNAP